jgi:AraC-like DNA-binding protein
VDSDDLGAAALRIRQRDGDGRTPSGNSPLLISMPCGSKRTTAVSQQGEFDLLVERALNLTGDPCLGLRMGAAQTLQRCLAGQVVLQAVSMRGAVELVERYHRLYSDDLPLRIEERDSTLVIKLVFANGSTRCHRFGAEIAVSGCFRMLEYFVPGARPHLVAFDYRAPPYRSEYTRVFAGTERFQQPFTGLIIDRALVDAHQGSRDEELHTLMRAQAAKRLAQLEQSASYADKVHELVTATDGRASDMISVARGLGIEPRSLRRRLAEESVTFRPVVNHALASVAMRLLVDERKSVQQTSYEMSFSNVSSFCRAFKRWTGSTPSEYRSANARKLARVPSEYPLARQRRST